jgi:hypothetical protein
MSRLLLNLVRDHGPITKEYNRQLNYFPISSVYQEICKVWRKLLASERIVELPESHREITKLWHVNLLKGRIVWGKYNTILCFFISFLFSILSISHDTPKYRDR